MEDMLWKFPHIGENIFKKLSKKNLAKCKKVSRSWEYFITNEKFYKQRVHYEMKQKDKDNHCTVLNLLSFLEVGRCQDSNLQLFGCETFEISIIYTSKSL